ncbi:ATP-binding protein [Pseudonocardia sp. GCM10023141]|uniref:ATP-binding protein n=1 Tax=Pseudonocardia sp. GCM10023141 TaxID=3252653 RepID=UPI0036127369
MTLPRLTSRRKHLRRRWTVPADAESPAVLRIHARSELVHWDVPGPAIDEAIMVLNELVSNALQHSRARTEVRLSYNGDRIRIRVRDDSAQPPNLRPRSLLAVAGRGLQLVDAIAHGWGWRPHAIGKTVWASIRTGPVSPAPGVVHYLRPPALLLH